LGRRLYQLLFHLSLTEVSTGAVLCDAEGITLPMAIKVYCAHGNADAHNCFEHSGNGEHYNERKRVI